jgi:hypothetical protein
VLANFVPCGRCSFFIAGYRVIHGLESLQKAAGKAGEQWLALRWDPEVRHLVQKSYGGELDVELFYYDGRCPECQRRFIYEEGDQEGEPDSFRIELKQ